MCGTKFLYSKTPTAARVVTLRCRSWTCPRCAPRRQRRLKWQARAGKPITFLTLTCNPQLYAAPGDAARDLTRAWRAARRTIEAHYGGKKGEYLTVVETTQRGWPHLHVLTTRKWIDQRWLSELWRKLTGAHIVDIRRVTNERMAASYVAKYMAKAPVRFDRCKRYYFTRGYLPRRDAPAPAYDWSSAEHETITGNPLVLIAALKGSGHAIVEAKDGYCILSAPPPCAQPPPTEPVLRLSAA